MELITHTNSDSNNPFKAIIALHGWTGDEFVFEPVAKMLKIDRAKWFFPRAPYKAEKKEKNNKNDWDKIKEYGNKLNNKTREKY